MRKFIVLPLLVLLAACTDDGVIMPVGPDGPLFAKKCSSPPCDKGGGGGGDADGEYTIADLGTLSGNTASMGSGINVNLAGGIQVVGMSWGGEAGLEESTVWTVVSTGGVTVAPLEMRDTQYAWALAITETGIAVGQSGFRPVYWDANGSINSLLLGDNVTRGRANDVSLVDGEVFIVGQQRTTPAQAVYWVGSPFALRLLPIFEAGKHASAQAVNSQGTIAGYSTGPHAVVWHPDGAGDYRVCDLGLNSIAFGISEATTDGLLVHVAGYTTTDHFATVWTVNLGDTQWQPDQPATCAATVRSLDFHSEFRDVNAQGDAVGEDSGKHSAILWPGGGSNALVYLPSLPHKGLSSDFAFAISADGTYIAGRSRTTKRSTHAVLWTRKN